MLTIVSYIVYTQNYACETDQFKDSVVCTPCKILVLSPYYHVAINCRDPGTPTNGHRNLSSTAYKSVVTYTCEDGQTLQGANSRACQSNGNWSGSVPECTRRSTLSHKNVVYSLAGVTVN